MRRILHVDMDAFYASVEQRDEPSLRGKPVAVGGRPENRGVVAAASYEARRFGVRSAMSTAKALRLCPSLVVVPPDFARYKAASRQVFSLFREVTPLVEPLSLDEAYLDVTTNAWQEPLGMVVARRIKAAIFEATSLTASAGVAPNKFLAKIASAWQKPDGLTVIAPGRVESFLQRLPVDALWGVGPVTAAKLRSHGIVRLVDVRAVPLERLHEIVGSSAEWLHALSHGQDDRPVVANRVAKSSGAERTYAQDLTDPVRMQTEVAALAARAAGWLRDRSLAARTVTVKVRYRDFRTVTRSDSAPPSDDPDAFVARALELLERTDANRTPVRLLGVSVHNLVSSLEATRPAPDGRLPFEIDSGDPTEQDGPTC